MTQESAEEKGQENSDDSVQGDAPESAQEAIPVESEETAPEMTPENSEETVQESVQEAVASAPDETVEESAVETVPVTAEERAPNGLEEKKWYVIHTYSGYEQKVKVNLFDQFEHSDCKENLAEIVIPTEKVVEIRKGKKKISSRKFFPGYVLISVAMTQDIWYMIKNTPKVTGFLGGGSTPVPLSEKEVKTIMDQIKGEAQRPKPKFSFERGENIRVIEGPFINFNGVVEDVNQDKGKVKVMVSIFGRATPVELEFPQIERV